MNNCICFCRTFISVVVSREKTGVNKIKMHKAASDIKISIHNEEK